MARVFVGTSGFNYKHWGNGIFYPKGLSTSKWLEYYCQSYQTVELNVTFYRLPEKLTFENWYNQSPKNFVFAIKGSRFITHIKKLHNVGEAVESFFENASGLREKLGVVLWQFGGNLHANAEKLEEFCRLLNRDPIAKVTRHAFEFRHQSWFSDEILKVLKKHNFSLCIAHSTVWPCVEETTADWVYLRFHGSRLYTSNYSNRELGDWAAKIRKWMGEGKDVYAYFDNDALGYAPENAKTLLEFVAGEPIGFR